MNMKGASGEVSNRNEEHTIGNWREGELAVGGKKHG